MTQELIYDGESNPFDDDLEKLELSPGQAVQGRYTEKIMGTNKDGERKPFYLAVDTGEKVVKVPVGVQLEVACKKMQIGQDYKISCVGEKGRTKVMKVETIS